jgi:HSP20 family protein
MEIQGMSFIQFRSLPVPSQREQVRQVYQQFFGPVGEREASQAWSPRVDVREEAGRFVILADIPGVDPQSIQVEMDKGVLSLSGERAADAGEEGVSHIRRERASGRFLRRFSLPDSVDAEAITATGQHGVLRIEIPKRPAATPRRIQVQ